MAAINPPTRRTACHACETRRKRRRRLQNMHKRKGERTQSAHAAHYSHMSVNCSSGENKVSAIDKTTYGMANRWGNAEQLVATVLRTKSGSLGKPSIGKLHSCARVLPCCCETFGVLGWHTLSRNFVAGRVCHPLSCQ